LLHRRPRRVLVPFTLFVVFALVLGACGSSSKSSSPASGTPSGSSNSVTLRLGYFPNVTHAPAIIGVAVALVLLALYKPFPIGVVTVVDVETSKGDTP